MDTPPPPPPPEIVKSLFSPSSTGYALQDTSPTDGDGDSSSSLSISPSILIISAIIAFVILISASIKLLLRYNSARRGGLSSASPSAAAGVFPLPFSFNRRSSSASFSSASTVQTASDNGLSEEKKTSALIDSLPIFSLASSLATVPKSSPDCAVCLNPFLPHDELRLLPACRHAFHSSCVDIWLRTTPSCPLCRASITLPAPPILPLATAATSRAGGRESPRSGSFRIEIGSISRRRSSVDFDSGNRHPTPAPVPPSAPPRTYSIGLAWEYLVDQEMEVEAVLARIPRRTEEEKRPETEGGAAPAPPGEEVAEAAGRGSGRSGSWLREYVDRLASSTSSSLSSLRLSGRWSHRYDVGSGGGARPPWDLEGSAGHEAEDGAIYGFYRWLVGAY